MFEVGVGLLVVAWVIGFYYLLSIQSWRVPNVFTPPAKDRAIMADSIVPVEDRVVPTHASYSNKFNDVIGNANSGLMQPAPAEVVIPSDIFHWPYLPSEFDGKYWPSGSMQPDYIYPGQQDRPLRPQNMPSNYTSLLVA